MAGQKVRFTPEVTRVGDMESIVLNAGSYDALLLSEGHYRLPNGAWSGGGPFYCEHVSLTHRVGAYERLKSFRYNGNQQYTSAAGAIGHPVFSVPVIGRAQLQDALDQTAGHSLRGYVNTRPGTSEVDALVALKELITDGLPSIPFQAVLKGPLSGLPYRLMAHIRNARQLGGEYLNVVFGWKPFIRDLRQFYKLTYDIDAAVKKLARQNGHRIRRRAVLVDNTNTTTEGASFNAAYVYAYGGSGQPNNFGAKSVWSKTVKTEERVWYSACYRYWIPDVASPAWQRRARRALFGATPTPGALWDAMPWSWLINWAADLSALAHALSPTAVDNLVQLYGYTMRRTCVTTETSCLVTYPKVHTEITNQFGTFGFRWEACDSIFASRHKVEKKMRFGGISPFGAGSASAGLTAMQTSILAALGVTRAPAKAPF